MRSALLFFPVFQTHDSSVVRIIRFFLFVMQSAFFSQYLENRSAHVPDLRFSACRRAQRDDVERIGSTLQAMLDRRTNGASKAWQDFCRL